MRDFKAAIVCIIKNEAEYLPEWLCFHLAVGFEHFFLYDNNSTDATREVLAPYVQEGVVTLMDWPKTTGQLPAYIHAIRMFGATADWFCMIDADEFVVPKAAPDIRDFLDGFEASQIYLPWKVFGFSGHRTRPSGLLIENFTIAENIERHEGKRVHCKYLVRPRDVKVVGVHNCLMRAGETVNWEGEPAPPGNFPTYRPFDSIQLNHYFYKSFEEFGHKIARGSATGAVVKKPVPFEALDATFGSIDTAALRFRDATREKLAYFGRLPQRLFRYGRRLTNRTAERVGQMEFNSDLAFFDPFRWFTRRATSNAVHGEAEMRAEYRKIEARGMGNRYSLLLPDRLLLDDPSWTANLHFAHLGGLLCADWMEELREPAPDPAKPGGATPAEEDATAAATPAAGGATPRWTLPLPASPRIHSYAVIAAITVAGAGRVGLSGRLPAGGGAATPPEQQAPVVKGTNLLVIEANAEPAELDALILAATLPAKLERVLILRYG